MGAELVLVVALDGATAKELLAASEKLAASRGTRGIPLDPMLSYKHYRGQKALAGLLVLVPWRIAAQAPYLGLKRCAVARGNQQFFADAFTETDKESGWMQGLLLSNSSADARGSSDMYYNFAAAASSATVGYQVALHVSCCLETSCLRSSLISLP